MTLAAACLSGGLEGAALGQGVPPPSAPLAALTLEWEAPAGCPGRESVLEQIQALARDDVVSWERFEVVRGRVSERAGGWSLELSLVRSGGVSRRHIESARCADLAQAAAVAIVLAHRSGEGRGESGWTAATSGPHPAANEAAADEAAANEAPSERAADASAASAASAAGAGAPGPDRRDVAEPLMLTLGARALLDPTTLGAAALGAELDVGLARGPWSAALYGVLFPSVETSVGAGQAIALGLLAAGAQGCRRWAPGLGTCLGVELGQVWASPVGLDQASSAHDLWLAPNASLELASQPLPWLTITAGAALLVPLVRGEFRVDEAEVHRVPPLAARVGLGVRVPILP